MGLAFPAAEAVLLTGGEEARGRGGLPHLLLGPCVKEASSSQLVKADTPWGGGGEWQALRRESLQFYFWGFFALLSFFQEN